MTVHRYLGYHDLQLSHALGKTGDLDQSRLAHFAGYYPFYDGGRVEYVSWSGANRKILSTCK